MPEPTDLRLSLTTVTEFDSVLAIWDDLQRRAAASWFLSSGWMRAWLECLPANICPGLLIAERGDRVVGLGLLGRHRERRRFAIVANGLFLNETGDEKLDHLTIEHNGFLADSECEAEVLRAMLDFLADSVPDWDEFSLRAVNANNMLCELLGQPRANLRARMFREEPVPTIDLRRLRESGTEYLGQLGSNMRSQLRRAVRMHEEQFGKLAIERPETVADALLFYEELKQRHQAHWQSRGEWGAFGNEFCDRFHRTLIAQRWPCGEIQLLRIRAGSRVVGLVYNFLYRGRVLMYQMGLDYSGDAKLKPGIVCQFMAIEYNLRHGTDIYDFLFGDDQYKRSLSTDSESLRWFVWQRPRWRFRFENWLRKVKQACVGRGRQKDVR